MCYTDLVKDEWNTRFMVTSEDYLHGLITMVNELVSISALFESAVAHAIHLKSRWAVNAVTLGDYERPIRISIFVKDLFTGFTMVIMLEFMWRILIPNHALIYSSTLKMMFCGDDLTA